MELYDTIGRGYSTYRRPDPRIGAALLDALGDARSVVNVGAGAGSYEPPDRDVIAIEPSRVMINQRAPGAARCLQGSADAIPLDNDSVDAAIAILSAHHWPDLERGLHEMARTARRRVVLLTWVPDAAPFWLTSDYFPEIAAHDRTIFPDTTTLIATLTRIVGPTRMTPLPIPHDCTDGFLCAYWRRPHAYLDADVRSAISSFARVNAAPGVERLHADLQSGHWQQRNRALMPLDELDAGYRVFSCDIARDRGSAAMQAP